MKAYLTLLLICLISLSAIAQEESSENNTNDVYSPTIGVGVNSIGFYGDLNDRDYGSPIGGNPGVNIYIVQPINKFLNIRFEFLAAQVRDEERSIQRNVNFKSDIRTGSLFLEYNFGNFLPENRKLTPFIASGIEAVEFNPKTDLIGHGGEPYFYWSDGSIRNLAENSPQAENAVLVRRDYDYETDIREAGFNNSTDYLERALSIPVGAGVIMHLNDQFNFRLQSTVHFTFTDLMDGITPTTSAKYVDNKRGNGRNDFFVASGISLSYNFQKVEPAEPFERFDKDEEFDFLASGNTEDFDNDGVIDLVDNCPNTPRGIQVDSLGCPIDSDLDGIPDYKDEEINTEYPEFANAQGVEMTDEMLYKSYLQYIDSTLEMAEVIERDFTGVKKNASSYRVEVESYSQDEAPSDMSKLLSLRDLSKIDQNGRTIFAVGNYKTLNEANARVNLMKSQGFSNARVIKKASNGKFMPLNGGIPSSETQPTIENSKPATTESKPSSESSSETKPNTSENSDESGVVFRVQLGAFKNKPTEETFRSIPSLFVVESGGYYRYMSGSFDNFEEAAKHKVKMVVKGYKGAFVVAFKDGKKVTLKSVGVNPISSDPIIGK